MYMFEALYTCTGNLLMLPNYFNGLFNYLILDELFKMFTGQTVLIDY